MMGMFPQKSVLLIIFSAVCGNQISCCQYGRPARCARESKKAPCAGKKREWFLQMSNIFNMDNPFFRALGRLADLMILNLLFIICSIPIFTIGASWTALSYVTLKLAENEEGYIARGFFKSFKQNFKQATVIWLIMLLLGIVLAMDMMIMRQATGTVADVFRVLITATIVVFATGLLYVFPVLARFYNTIRGTVKNAYLMAIANLPRTVLILLVVVASVLVTFLNTYTLWYGVLVWILAGFALVAYANAFFFKKVFARYMPADEEEEKNPDEWDLDQIGETALDVKPEIAEGETDEETTAETPGEMDNEETAETGDINSDETDR